MIFIAISICFFSFLAFAYTLLNSDSITYPLIYLLPFTLCILSILFFNLFKLYKNSWVFKIFLLQVIIRYPIMSIVYCSAPLYLSNIRVYSNIVIIMMILELIFCFIILGMFSNRQSKLGKYKHKEIRLNQNYLIIYITIIAMFTILLANNSFNEINFIVSLNQYIAEHIEGENSLQDSSIAIVLFTPLKVLLALTLIQKIYTSKIRNHLKKWVYLLIIIASSFFVYGMSRFSLILFSIPLLGFITTLVTKRDANQLIRSSSIIIITALFFASIAKFSRYGNEATTNDLIDVGSINAYFSGPDNIRIGLMAYDSINNINSLLFFINDTLQNVPLLSKLTSDSYKLNLVFNKQFYGHNLWVDQIVPLDISGLFHFGLVGIPLYYCLFLSLALLFERKAYTSYDFFYKYSWMSLSISFSFIFMMNVSTFYASLAGNILFLFLPFWVINKFRLKRI